MGKLFWVFAVLGLGSVMLSNLFEKGDLAVLQKAWEGPEGAIVVSGMPAQIELMTQIADEYGWSIACERKSGELTLVEFIPSFRAKFTREQDTYNEVSMLSTSHARLYEPSGERFECGGGPSGASGRYGNFSFGPEQLQGALLAFGTQSELAPEFDVAERCELEGLRLRPLTQTEKELIGGEIRSDQQGLSVDIDDAKKDQLLCFMVVSAHEGGRI